MTRPTPEWITVDSSAAQMRIENFLFARGHLDRDTALELLRAGNVRVMGRPVSAGLKLRAGDIVTWLPPLPPAIAAEPIALDVLYEDADLVAVNKPPRMATHPTPSATSGTLVNALLHRFGDSLSHLQRDPARVGVVHRLDRDTSGVIVIARTDAAHESLVRQFSRREVSKRYLAVCYGLPDPQRQTIDAPIGPHRNPHVRDKQVVRDDGKPATTTMRVLRPLAGGEFALVECRPRTGRTHQIRVHLRHIGHPVVGDLLYAGGYRLPRFTAFRRVIELAPDLAIDADPDVVIHRQALHSASIELRHPRTGERLVIDAPLPDDMATLIDVLLGDDTGDRRSPPRAA